MKSTGMLLDAKKLAELGRFKVVTPHFSLNNGSVYSFAVNEITSELLYADNHGIHLVTYDTNEEVKSIPYTDLIKQELSRYTERKQQEILATYSSHGVQYLNVLQLQNLWLGVISRKRFVFFNEELTVSSESPIDISGITCLKVQTDTGDVFTLTGDGKVLMWGCEVIADAGKKRPGDFDVKIMMKKKFALESPITRFDITISGPPLFACSSEPVPTQSPAVAIWDYSTGERQSSVSHSESSSVSIQALGLKHPYLVLLDSVRNLAVVDLVQGAEIYKRGLGQTLALVDTILVEEAELSSGVYLMDAVGRVFDYSVTNSVMRSTFLHAKTRENVPMTSPRNSEKALMAVIRGNVLDDKASPGSSFSRFNTCFRLIAQHSGLKQLWALYDGTLIVVALAATGKVLSPGGLVRHIRKLPLQPGQTKARVLELTMDSGCITLFDTDQEKVLATHTAFLEVLNKKGETLSLCRLAQDFSLVISITDSGNFLCYDTAARSPCLDFQLSKIVVTALCLVPHTFEPEVESTQLDIVIGTDSGLVLVFVYTPRRKAVELLKRYAGHDLVVSLEYRPWDRKVLSVGRDGYIKFLLCDQYYEWEASSVRGYWSDCTACTTCGQSMVLLGYQSGMLQTLYFSPSANMPTNALLEYHTSAITCVNGLKYNISEGVSADALGNLVLWSLDTSDPLKVFQLYSPIEALISFGLHQVETLYVVINGALLKVNVDRSVAYKQVSKRDVQSYRAEAKRRRLEQKKRTARPLSIYSVPKKSSSAEPISILYSRVLATKVKVQADPLLVRAHGLRQLEEETLPELRTEDRSKDRPLHQIIERNHIERFKKSLAITIRHCNQWVPRELMFNGRFKTRSLLITPTHEPHGRTLLSQSSTRKTLNTALSPKTQSFLSL